MDRRLLSLAPLAPAIAIIVFAAAGAAAQGLAAARANAIEDVQVGEAGKLLRVALICRADCRVAARASGVFFLPGVKSSLDIDLASRSANADGLKFEPVDGGSTMTIRADKAIVSASIKKCQIDAAPASCIDFEFAAAPTRTAAAAAAPTPRQAPAKPAAKPDAPDQRHAGAAPQIPPPPLREAPGRDQLVFARFAPPERLAPPEDAFAAPASPRGTGARRPIIDREKAATLLAGGIDIGAAATQILGRKFDIGDCGGAEARLRNNAWALEAMVDVGFCKAIDGDLEGADQIFIRLLEFTPDNYEALVGRALIAAKAGEKGVARKYFQDALNALPPIAQSDRIVKAMAEL